MSEAVEIEREVVPRPPNHYTEPEFVTVAGVPTAYRRKGAGEPVLFLHGAGATRMWMPFYEECASAVDFIAPEHPGFGETPMPPWLKDFTDVVIHYERTLRPGRAASHPRAANYGSARSPPERPGHCGVAMAPFGG